jgi:hypothetical protein
MPKRLILLLVVSSLALLAVLVGAVYMFVVFIEGAASATPLDGRSIRIALSTAFVLGAALLYALKKSRAQFAYGLVEIAVGLVANWQSLDAWSNPALNQGGKNIFFARLAIIGAGIYLISRGLSNVVDGFVKLLPISWASVKQLFMEGYNQPTGIPVPTRLLKYQIAGITEALANKQTELDAALRTGADNAPINADIEQLREELRIANERFELEVKHPKDRAER